MGRLPDVPASALPSGRYISAPIDLSPDAGGQTRAILLRNRILVQEAGIAPTILTFNAVTDLDQRRQIMLERGLLLPEISTLNLYRHYRQSGWEDEDRPGEDLEDLRRYKIREECLADGSPWRVVYGPPEADTEIYEYLRPDGSPFLRIPDFRFKRPGTWPTNIIRIGRHGAAVGRYGSLGQWFRSWVREVAGRDRTFVFIDSRYNAQHLIPMRARNIFLLYVLHNIHVAPPRLWSSEMNEIYSRLLKRVDGMDAMVTLTHRQMEDIALRRGRSNNLFVVPNPVDLPAPPTPPISRDPRLVAVVARLERQKRLLHAVKAFELVKRQVPDAVLHIYGEGEQRSVLEEQIEKLGLRGSVILNGHDPHARDRLWAASAFIMTSEFEGYPLSTLESLSHGCPVVSYDIKYGPKEQITDSVDGFLVADGDVQALADRIVRLLRSPSLVADMGSAARDKARQHGVDNFTSDWAQVIESIIALKGRRVRIDRAELAASRIMVVRRPSYLSFGRRRGPRTRVEIAGTVHAKVEPPGADPASAQLTLVAFDRTTGGYSELPLTVSTSGEIVHFSSKFHPEKLASRMSPAKSAHLRLGLVWNNATWHSTIAADSSTVTNVNTSPGSETVMFDNGGRLTLRFA